MAEPPSSSRPPSGAARGRHPEPSPLDALSEVELDALRWSVRAADGLTSGERIELEAWLGAAPAHRAAFDDVGGVWDAIGAIPATGRARLSSVVAIDRAAASSAPPRATAFAAAAPASARGPNRRRLAGIGLGWAALSVTAGGVWIGWDHHQHQPVFSQRYETQRGQQLTASLPDGSRLLLDTDTAAEVTLYRQRREVRLPEGQVLFTVQGDAARPFDVRAGAARITVVGTKFSVRYTPSLGSREVQVGVIEGRVRVASAGAPADTVSLARGQVVTVDAAGRPGSVEPTSPQAWAPWQAQRLVFQDQPLDAVLAELTRYGLDGFEVADARVGRLAVTASVDLRKPADFLAGLPQVLPVRIERRDGRTVIVGTGRP